MQKDKDQHRMISKKEKNISFLYVALLFVIATTVCSVLLFCYNTNFSVFSRKDFVVMKMERIRSFQRIQAQQVELADSLEKKIQNFNPGVMALYEESDIKYMLNEMKSLYEKGELDKRFKVFLHVAVFYETWFADKKELWSKQQNVMKFTGNLEECEIGLKTKKDELNSHFKK